jgi:hypothetical protein
MSDQLPMFGVPDTLAYQPQSETSRGAAEAVRPAAVTDRAAVLSLLTRKLSGMTDEEIQRSLKLNPSTERPRRIELVQAGKVRDSGRTRPTVSGRAATVWEIVPSAG